MISYLKGIYAGQNPDGIIVEAGGIGYAVCYPAGSRAELPAVGEPVKIYTYLYLKEDVLALYGFPTEDELGLFRLLLKVSGVGPKGAMSVLSGMTARELRAALISQDAKTIAKKSSGIGLKTAQKMILELKDKVSADFPEDSGTAAGADASDLSEDDAVLALTALGYSLSAAVSAVSSVAGRESMSTEEVLKAALKSGKLF